MLTINIKTFILTKYLPKTLSCGFNIVQLTLGKPVYYKHIDYASLPTCSFWRCKGRIGWIGSIVQDNTAKNQYHICQTSYPSPKMDSGGPQIDSQVQLTVNVKRKTFHEERENALWTNRQCRNSSKNSVHLVSFSWLTGGQRNSWQCDNIGSGSPSSVQP